SLWIPDSPGTDRGRRVLFALPDAAGAGGGRSSQPTGLRRGQDRNRGFEARQTPANLTMEPDTGVSRAAAQAPLAVADRGGHRTRVPIEPLPFQIGRQPESQLILRDSRVSRVHARILVENGQYVLEDCSSRHGTFVNGKRITRQTLANADRIEFGTQ